MKDQWPTFISGNLEWEVWARSRYDMTKKKEKKKRAEKMCGQRKKMRKAKWGDGDKDPTNNI